MRVITIENANGMRKSLHFYISSTISGSILFSRWEKLWHSVVLFSNTCFWEFCFRFLCAFFNYNWNHFQIVPSSILPKRNIYSFFLLPSLSTYSNSLEFSENKSPHSFDKCHWYAIALLIGICSFRFSFKNGNISQPTVFIRMKNADYVLCAMLTENLNWSNTYFCSSIGRWKLILND